MTRYILIGPMGSGKSTVAKILGRRLGCEVTDSDRLLEAQEGRRIQQIFIDDGEAAFRDLERAVVHRLVTDDAVPVLALGGGAVLDADTQTDLLAAADRGASVVFLDVPASAGSHRVGLGAGRPLLLGNPRATWIRLLEERRPTYERLSTMVVDTGERGPDAVADQILQESP